MTRNEIRWTERETVAGAAPGIVAVLVPFTFEGETLSPEMEARVHAAVRAVMAPEAECTRERGAWKHQTGRRVFFAYGPARLGGWQYRLDKVSVTGPGRGAIKVVGFTQ
jgi:hypothetical protein